MKKSDFREYFVMKEKSDYCVLFSIIFQDMKKTNLVKHILS